VSACPNLGPGLHDGIPSDVYHADPCPTPSLSSGVLRTIIAKSIEHAALEHSRIGGQKREAKPAMTLGSIVHSLLAGENSDLVLGNFDSFRSKASQEWKQEVEASGKTPVLERDLEDARPVANAIREKAAIGITNDPFVATGRSEVTAIWKEGDVYCRARYDRLVIDPNGYADIWDWKTIADISERSINKAIAHFGYHIQEAFYTRGLTAVLPEYIGRTSFIFAFAEVTPPYQVRRVKLSPSYLAIGRRRVGEGIAAWQHALGTNDFKAPVFDTLEIEAPAYLEDDDEISIS
jgi:hypothetical protein